MQLSSTAQILFPAENVIVICRLQAFLDHHFDDRGF